MAKKGQKINKYSRKFKLKICYDYKYGNLGGYRKVAEKYNISFSTAKNWITLMRKYGNIEPDKRGKYKRPITLEDYKEKYKLYNMCVVLDISPKTYYKYRSKEDTDYYNYLIIKKIFDDSKGTYGYRRVVE